VTLYYHCHRVKPFCSQINNNNKKYLICSVREGWKTGGAKKRKKERKMKGRKERNK
jgi:hypothetical protein